MKSVDKKVDMTRTCGVDACYVVSVVDVDVVDAVEGGNEVAADKVALDCRAV